MLDFFEKIKSGPSVLFLGQSFIRINGQDDPFFKKVCQKYKLNEEANSYSELFNIQEENSEAKLAWMSNLSNILTAPTWLETISRVAWSSVYTSSILTLLDNIFKNEWRDIQPIYNKNFKISDPRNKVNLHITYLFGCVNQSELLKRPPLNRLEYTARGQEAASLRLRLPEIITPKGVFIVEGYNLNDWLIPEDFYSLVNSFGKNQTHLFSCGSELLQNEFITDLIKKEKIVIHEESLSGIIEKGIANGIYEFSLPEQENYYGSYLKIGTNRIKLPDNLKTKLSRTGILIEDRFFDTLTNFSDDSIFWEFKNFLSAPTTIPKWTGYRQGFAFERDYMTTLKVALEDRYKNIDNERPIIVHGQASSGKTIGLGYLAYEIYKKQAKTFKTVTLFIERSYKRLDDNDLSSIDIFCQWAEDNGADRTIIIWDGMQDYSRYENVLKILNSRGRKIILIGSSYLIKKVPNNYEKNFILVPIELSRDEKSRFVTYIRKFLADRPILGDIIKEYDSKNFLAILYTFLPETKATINKLVREEAKYVSETISSKSEKNAIRKPSSIFRDLFIQAGIIDEQDAKQFDEEVTIGGETETTANQIINLIMVSGQFGLPIPFELLIRCLNTDVYQSNLINRISDIDIIRWDEDHLGNISLGPRTSLEAKIITYRLGGKATEIEYIKQILVAISDLHSFGNDYDFGSNEIHFAVELLFHLKSETSGKSYKEYLFEIAETLKKVREEKNILHPRLMLQEANCLRESVKSRIKLPEDKFDILTRAENVLRQALSIVKNKKSQLYSFLLVELASVLGSKSVEKLKTDNIEARAYYEEAKHQIIQTHSLTAENYPSLDVMFWTIRDLYKNSKTDALYKAELKAEVLNLIQIAEEEKVSDAYILDFNEKKQQFGQIFKDEKLSQSAFNALLAKGSKAGFYLRAKEIIDGVDFTQPLNDLDFKKCKSALQYLENVESEFKDDSHCLYLLLRLWWIVKNQIPIFFGEKNTTKFTQEDWSKCLSIVSRLLQGSELYLVPTLKYLQALSLFHLGDVRGTLDVFNELELDTDYVSYGKRRIIISYIASDEAGIPVEYSGHIAISAKMEDKTDKTEIYVNELRKNVKLFLRDFRIKSVQKDESFQPFNIGFNFIGLRAIPSLGKK